MADRKTTDSENDPAVQKLMQEATRSAMAPVEDPGLEKKERANIKEVQNWLRKDDPGLAANGVWNPATEKALTEKLSKYQKENGLSRTGTLDFDTLLKMRQDALDKGDKADPSLKTVTALGELQRLDIARRNDAEQKGQPYKGDSPLQKGPPASEGKEQISQETVGGNSSGPPMGSTMNAPARSTSAAKQLEMGDDVVRTNYVVPSPGPAFMAAARALPDEPSAPSAPTPAPAPKGPDGP